MAEPLDGEIICGSRLSQCICTEPPEHDGPHVCGRDNGSWAYDDYGRLCIVAFPNLAKIFGL